MHYLLLQSLSPLLSCADFLFHSTLTVVAVSSDRNGRGRAPRRRAAAVVGYYAVPRVRPPIRHAGANTTQAEPPS
jgi:hypothetical protein